MKVTLTQNRPIQKVSYVINTLQVLFVIFCNKGLHNIKIIRKCYLQNVCQLYIFDVKEVTISH